MDRQQPLTEHIRPDRRPLDLNEYEQAGGYQAVRKALQQMTPQEVQQVVSDANLRGRGGAGFSTGMKWSFVPMGDEARDPKYLCVNADEMEPGTFKDRLLLEGDPHQIVEAALVASYAIQADVAYIFLRWAYQTVRRSTSNGQSPRLTTKAIWARTSWASGYALEMYLHVSAGRYMCGEETGLLNALEGKRASPRAKPPYPQSCGLWGHPTVVNNVETLANVPQIVNSGADWFKRLSLTDDGGTKLYGVSGRVKRPGLWELPMGTTLREILEEHAGGMCDGYRFRGVLPGGASTDFLVEEHLDVKMDFDSVSKAGSRLGTGTMIVLDDRTLPRRHGCKPGRVLCPGIVWLVHSLP